MDQTEQSHDEEEESEGEKDERFEDDAFDGGGAFFGGVPLSDGEDDVNIRYLSLCE